MVYELKSKKIEPGDRNICNIYKHEGRWFWRITSPAGEFVAIGYRGYGTHRDAQQACTNLASGIWGEMVFRLNAG